MTLLFVILNAVKNLQPRYASKEPSPYDLP
jgi:hypothetical protein